LSYKKSSLALAGGLFSFRKFLDYTKYMSQSLQKILALAKQHKTITLLGLGTLIVILAGAGIALMLNNGRPITKNTLPQISLKKTPVPPKPTTKPSPLTGLIVANELADRPITGVIIENHTNSRPQSGLSQAGVVYEALAEGGITRFLAFFLDQRPEIIGPVRSLRTYFVDWGLEFNSPVAHAGGNADALDLVKPLALKDIDGLVIGAPTFYRVNDRYAPHNLYTTSSLLDAQLVRYNYHNPSNFTPSSRKPDSPPAAGSAPAHPVIRIDYSYNGYQVEYRYDSTSNDYLRFMAGAPHIDRNTGAQIRVKNIVVQYMPTTLGTTTRIGEQTVIMGTPGNGQAIVFRDGSAAVGTWTKPNHTSRTKLLDSTGAPIPLNAGNTWYSIVPTTKPISY
jgi:hypothetical protein